MKNRRISKLVADGLLYKNPLLIKLLSLSVAVLSCGTLKGALAMGVCVLAVLVLSALTVSALKPLMTERVRAVCSLLIACGYATALGIVVKALLPSVDALIGEYIPLIAASGLCVAHGAGFASKNSVGVSALSALFSGLGYTLAIMVVGFVRELFGRGQIFGLALFDGGLNFFNTPAGGFICLAILAAVVTFISNKRRDEHDA